MQGFSNEQLWLSILVSCGFHNKWLQTGWLKTTETYYLTVWWPRVWNQCTGKIGSFQRLWKNPLHSSFLASGSCWQSVCSLACRLYNSSICLYFHMTFSSAYPCFLLLLGHSLCDLGTIWIVQNYLILIPLKKIFFLFIHFWLHWVLLCIGFSLVVASKGSSLVAVLGLLIAVASLVAKHGL